MTYVPLHPSRHRTILDSSDSPEKHWRFHGSMSKGWYWGEQICQIFGLVMSCKILVSEMLVTWTIAFGFVMHPHSCFAPFLEWSFLDFHGGQPDHPEVFRNRFALTKITWMFPWIVAPTHAIWFHIFQETNHLALGIPQFLHGAPQITKATNVT